MKSDPGYFGPQSMMWKVNQEITVLFGGARAFGASFAHPLIVHAIALTNIFIKEIRWKG